MTRRILIVVLLAVCLPGCIRVTFRTTTRVDPPVPRPVSPHRLPPSITGVPVPKGKASSPAGLVQAQRAGTTEQNASNHFPVVFEMPACVERGRPATALVRTAKLSMIIASASYADGSNHGSAWTGSTDAEGKYTIAWTPPPDAPLGPAQILAGVNGDSGGATARRFFTLAAPGGCR